MSSLNPTCQRVPGEIESEGLSQEEQDKKPWKYIGYRGLATYTASDDDFFVLRRFDTLHSRVLLALQDNVSTLEEDLDLLDSRLSSRTAVDVDNGSVRNDQKERMEVLENIRCQLEKYDSLLCRYLVLKSRPVAPKHIVRNIKKWLNNRNNPIHPGEIGFLDCKDVISVSKSEKAPIRRIFEQHVLASTNGLYGLFAQKDRSIQGSQFSQTTVQGDDAHIDVLASIAIFSTAGTMLITPLWILATIVQTFQKIGVITMFTLVFLAVMNWGEVARPFEILAATAGYCGVLVVFLQLQGGDGPGI